MGSPTGPGTPLGRTAGGRSESAKIEVIATIKEAINDLSELMSLRHVDVELARSFEEVQVAGPAKALAEAMRNLIWNAIEASQPGALVRVAVHVRGENVIIDVSDDGSGISPESLSKIFEQGFTTKPGAAGMGLNIVERRLGELLGSIVWQSPVNNRRGARFTVTLPTIPPSPPTA